MTLMTRTFVHRQKTQGTNLRFHRLALILERSRVDVRTPLPTDVRFSSWTNVLAMSAILEPQSEVTSRQHVGCRLWVFTPHIAITRLLTAGCRLHSKSEAPETCTQLDKFDFHMSENTKCQIGYIERLQGCEIEAVWKINALKLSNNNQSILALRSSSFADLAGIKEMCTQSTTES